MPKALTVGKPAIYNHGGVRYSPFGAKPGQALALTSDPWSFLGSHLRREKQKSRKERRVCFDRALYYAELAHSFFHASESTPLPAKCTLVYYGALNLAKCFICTRGKLLGESTESHGLSPSGETDKDIQVSKRAKNHVNIFHEFVVALGSEQPTNTHLSLAECISHIPELHELAVQTGALGARKRNFLPVEIQILVDASEVWLFSDFCYWKKNETQVEAAKIMAGERANYFLPQRQIEKGKVAHRCKRRKRFSWANFERIYGNLCKEYSKFDIAVLLGRDGYRYYCDLNKPRYHHLAYTFLILFHFGTLTRYNPKGTEELMNGEFRPVLSEAIELCPAQLLYQLVSYITETTCVMPFAKL